MCRWISLSLGVDFSCRVRNNVVSRLVLTPMSDSLASFSICLLVFPRLLLFLAEPTEGRGALTSLERYLALQLGIILGTLAITIVAVVRFLDPYVLNNFSE